MIFKSGRCPKELGISFVTSLDQDNKLNMAMYGLKPGVLIVPRGSWYGTNSGVKTVLWTSVLKKTHFQVRKHNDTSLAKMFILNWGYQVHNRNMRHVIERSQD